MLFLRQRGAVGELDSNIPERLTERVVRLLDEHYIQSEKTTERGANSGHGGNCAHESWAPKIAKNYILYRRNIKNTRRKTGRSSKKKWNTAHLLFWQKTDRKFFQSGRMGRTYS